MALSVFKWHQIAFTYKFQKQIPGEIANTLEEGMPLLHIPLRATAPSPPFSHFT